MTATFVSVTGLFPMSVITKGMAAAIDSADDDGRISCSTQVLNRLVKYGLAEDKRLRGAFLTSAGWNVWGTLPAAPKHSTRTWETGESRLNWRKARMEPSRTAAWSCTCGASGIGARREEALAAARRHRIEGGTT